MPDTYHTAGLRRDRHLNFYGDQNKLGDPSPLRRCSPDRGWPALEGGGQLSIPVAHHAGMAEHRAGELHGRGAWIGGGADVVPVQEVLAQLLIPAGPGWGQGGPRELGRRRMCIREQRRLGWCASPGHQPTLTASASLALRVMKSLPGGSAGAPENSVTARSNDPHQAFTGVDRPRKGARKAASASAASVAAAK